MALANATEAMQMKKPIHDIRAFAYGARKLIRIWAPPDLDAWNF